MTAERRMSVFSADTEPPEAPWNGECWTHTPSGIEYRWADANGGVWVEGGAGAEDTFPAEPAIGDRVKHGLQHWRWNGIGWAKLRLSDQVGAEGDLALSEDGILTVDSAGIVGGGHPGLFAGAITMKAIDITGTDLNDLVLAGEYDGENLTHAPDGLSGWFFVSVKRHSVADTWVEQTAREFGGSTSRSWTRRRATGTWSDWQRGGDDYVEKLIADLTLTVGTPQTQVTISVASPAVVTWANHGLQANDPVMFGAPRDRKAAVFAFSPADKITAAGHGFAAGDPVRFLTTGTGLPVNFASATTYYVIASGLTADDFLVSTTRGGAAVNIVDAGDGANYVERYTTLPTGIVRGTVYYVRAANLTAGAFEISTTPGGAAVNTTGDMWGKLVCITGNDANSGRGATRATALLTVAAAVTKAAALDRDGHTITIVSNLPYSTAGIRLSQQRGVGASAIRSGEPTHSENYRIVMASGAALEVTDSQWSADGFHVESASGDGVLVSGGTLRVMTSMQYGSCTGAHVSVTRGRFETGGTAYITGNAAYGIKVLGAEASVVEMSRTIVAFNNPTFTAFVSVDQGGMISTGNTKIGPVTGQRWRANTTGSIQTYGSGSNYFPGTSAGEANNGGVYV